jgi:hypothetical protein
MGGSVRRRNKNPESQNKSGYRRSWNSLHCGPPDMFICIPCAAKLSHDGVGDLSDCWSGRCFVLGNMLMWNADVTKARNGWVVLSLLPQMKVKSPSAVL